MKTTGLVLSLLASAASVMAAPTSGDDIAIAETFNAASASRGGSNGPAIVCQTTDSSGYVSDAEALVSYLRTLPVHQACRTNQKTSDGHHAAVYRHEGNIAFGSEVTNADCSNVTVNCHTLAGYFEDIINTCKSHGRVQGVHFLAPSLDWHLTNPKSCKKTDNDFGIVVATV